MQEPSPEMVQTWKETFDTYRSRLSPNSKTGLEIVSYLTHEYQVSELMDDAKTQVVTDNILQNECIALKLPDGRSPDPKVFLIENTGRGAYLYENQDEVFSGIEIIAGIDLETGYFLVEGSSLLWDELFAFRGLDSEDLKNYYLVAEYIACAEKFGILETVIS